MRREAHFAIFAKSCDEAGYEKLVRALCKAHAIPILEVEEKAELGELVGQCKYDKEGKARKVVGCSCAVVKNYGRDDEAQVWLNDFLKRGGADAGGGGGGGGGGKGGANKSAAAATAADEEEEEEAGGED